MRPRSKQIKHELISCDFCGCLFTNKDSNVHAGICTKTVPFEIELKPVVSRDIIDYHNYAHGFIVDHVLVGSVEEVKAKDVPDHFPKNIRNRMILMNPATMKYLEIYIGKPVVIEEQEVFHAWPCSNIPLTAIRMIKTVIEELQYQQQKVMVRSLTHPDITAATVHCYIRNLEDIDIKEKQLNDHLLRVSVGRYITCGTILHLDYYGRTCDVCISRVVGDDDSIQGMQAKSDIMTSLSASIDKLNLETGSPEASSTPSKLDKSNEKKCHVPDLPMFYKISYNTKLVIDDESASDRIEMSVVGPSLRDFGGFSTQIKLIKETISVHLFRQQELAQQGLRSPGGLLLYGPSGGGKSMLINALAKEFSVYFVSISGAEIWSKYYGESEAKLLSLIKEAENRAPSILFLDEVDVLCPKRENTKNEIEKRIVATLLTSLDRLCNNRKCVFVLAATNKRQNVDSALRRPGRLDREVEIGVPSVDDRQEIIERLLNRTDHNISSAVIRDIAEKAHGFLGADLAAVCKEATLHAMREEPLGGKIILQSENLCYGLQMVKPSAMKEVTLEVSKVSWSDIGGQDELKEKLRQAVEWPLKYPEAFARLGIRPPRGLLMYGPPGCSKTMIAKALAKESGLNFIAIKGPELFSKWVGESERAVREIFSRARAAAPAIVFFDEIDALAGERGSHGGSGDVSDRVLAQLLTEMDGIQALEDILVVAATNRPDRIDKALMRPGRLDRIMYVPLPDAATRKAIFCLHFRKTPTASDVDVSELVKNTEGYSGAEVSAVCHEAALAALQEDINSNMVYNRHFSKALHIVKPRITAELLALYDKYRQVPEKPR